MKNLRVLVVDDNDTNRRILELTLEQWEMRPVCVKDGYSGIAELQTAYESGNKFDVALTRLHDARDGRNRINKKNSQR